MHHTFREFIETYLEKAFREFKTNPDPKGLLWFALVWTIGMFIVHDVMSITTTYREMLKLKQKEAEFIAQKAKEDREQKEKLRQQRKSIKSNTTQGDK